MVQFRCGEERYAISRDIMIYMVRKNEWRWLEMTANTGKDNNVYILGQQKNERREIPAVSREILEAARKVAEKYGFGIGKSERR